MHYGENEARTLGDVQYAAGAPSKTAQERAPGMAQEMAALDRTIHELADALNGLAERIRPVLLDSPPSTAGSEGRNVPDRNVCAIAEAVRGSRRQLDVLIQMAHDLRRRVDL